VTLITPVKKKIELLSEQVYKFARSQVESRKKAPGIKRQVAREKQKRGAAESPHSAATRISQLTVYFNPS